MTVRILLVDDNPTFVAAVHHSLKMLPGVEIIGVCNDGLDGLKTTRALLPDLVLLDVAMPEMGGLEVARNIRLQPNPPSIIFLSLYDDEAYESMAREMGAMAFINKADFVVRLLPIIEQLVAGHARQTT